MVYRRHKTQRWRDDNPASIFWRERRVSNPEVGESDMTADLEKRLRELGTDPRILHEEQLFLNSAADIIARGRSFNEDDARIVAKAMAKSRRLTLDFDAPFPLHSAQADIYIEALRVVAALRAVASKDSCAHMLTALERIVGLEDSEHGEPLDDAIRIARAALNT